MAFLTFAVVPKIEPPKLLDTKGFWRSGIFGILARDHEMRSELRAGPGGFGVGPGTSRDLSVLSKLLEQRNDAILPRKAVEQAACNWPPYRKKPDLGTNHIAATFRSFILPESISPVTILAR